MRINASASVPPRVAGELAESLEAAGCPGLYFAEIAHDPFLCIAAAGRSSQRLQLGTSVALAFTRGPTLLSYITHDLAELAEGRLVVGLGPQVRAHIERRFSMSWSDPINRMREVVAAMRTVWQAWEGDGPARYEGQDYQISLMPPEFRPARTGRPMPPIYLAAVGPKMAELAGEVADGLFVHAFSTPEYVRQTILPAVERGLRKSDRARAEFTFCYSAFTAVASDDAGAADATEAMRRGLAFYASTPAYRGVLATHGLADLQPALNRLTKQGRWDEMSALVPDTVLSLFTSIGPPGEVAEDLHRRWSGLVDRLMVPYQFWTGIDGPAWRRASERVFVE